jgi:GntR family transcriptional regulator, transcriptional repressor for pyruvate dehydrogenase complex
VHYLDLSPEVGRTTVRQHQHIVQAIADQDLDAGAGAQAMIDHLTYLREHLLAHYSKH